MQIFMLKQKRKRKNQVENKLHEAYSRLSNNNDFIMLCQHYFIDSVVDIVHDYNLDLPATIDDLKARAHFKSFLSGIMSDIQAKNKEQ